MLALSSEQSSTRPSLFIVAKHLRQGDRVCLIQDDPAIVLFDIQNWLELPSLPTRSSVTCVIVTTSPASISGPLRYLSGNLDMMAFGSFPLRWLVPRV